MAKVIGNRLGTTNSCVAVMEGGKAEGYRECGRRAAQRTPSVVAFTKERRAPESAQPAKRQGASTNRENRIVGVGPPPGAWPAWPIRRSPSLVKATTDGVVRARLPAFSITFGLPPSITATQLLVVPKSISNDLGPYF